MNCAECTHYHNLGDKLMCDAGLMEVTMVGSPQVVVKMPKCDKFLELVVEKLDKRTKEYKEKHK